MGELPPDPTSEGRQYLELNVLAARLTYEHTRTETDRLMLIAYLARLIDLIEAPAILQAEARYQ